MTITELLAILYPPNQPKHLTVQQEAIVRHPQRPAWVLAAPLGSPESETAISVLPGMALHPLPDRLTMFFTAALSTERGSRPSDAAVFLRACEQALT